MSLMSAPTCTSTLHQHQLFLRNISAVMNRFSVFYPGVDGISAQMLKATGTSIFKSITKLFNLSLKTGVFHTDWKFASFDGFDCVQFALLCKLYTIS